jgi:signal recognition particle subunit SRP19
MVIVEEIKDDDIDNMDFDPADFDPKKSVAAAAAASKPFAQSPSAATAQQIPPLGAMPGAGAIPMAGGIPILNDKTDMEEFKHWHVIYPVYFDKAKSHSEGRRVPIQLAVENPLAQTITAACKSLGVRALWEVAKCHPKDWANPGRVRVELREGGPAKNKRHLYRLVAQFLQDHPPTDKTPFESPLFQSYANNPEVSLPDKTTPLAVPTGWKLNEILPLNSRAIGGGEQSEEMMKQMQQQMFPGLSNLPSVPAKPKRQTVRAKR